MIYNLCTCMGGRKFHKRSDRTEVAEVLEFHQKELQLVILDQHLKMYKKG